MRVIPDMGQIVALRCRPEFAETCERRACHLRAGLGAGIRERGSSIAGKAIPAALAPQQTRIPSDPQAALPGPRPRPKSPKKRSVSLTFEEKQLLSAVGACMRSIASAEKPRTQGQKRPFEGKTLPKVKLEKYLQRMCLYLNNWKHACCAKYGVSAGIRALGITLLFIDRMCEVNPRFTLTMRNVHRLCAVGMLLATKFAEDNMFRNSYWCIVAGMPLEELNLMELEFCKMMDFDFHVSKADFDGVIRMLRRHVKSQEDSTSLGSCIAI